jgi:hypothetical protein
MSIVQSFYLISIVFLKRILKKLVGFNIRLVFLVLFVMKSKGKPCKRKGYVRASPTATRNFFPA